MESSDIADLPEVDDSLVEIDRDRLEHLEARLRVLEESIPKTRLLHRRFLPRAFAVFGHYLVAGLIMYLVAIAVFAAISGLGFAMHSGPFADDAVKEGPALRNVADLPVDASGEGVIHGVPTGEASTDDRRGSFVVVLDPAPAGLPDRTTLHVAFDHSTKVFRGGEVQGDPLDALNSDDGPIDADPSSAGSVIVRFHVRDGRVFADRLDLSDDYPSDVED